MTVVKIPEGSGISNLQTSSMKLRKFGDMHAVTKCEPPHVQSRDTETSVSPPKKSAQSSCRVRRAKQAENGAVSVSAEPCRSRDPE